MLLDTILKNLKEAGVLATPQESHVVLAYSGGLDSTVLLYLLASLRESHSLRVTAAYFNHHWRGNPEELPVLHANCEKAGVPLVLVQADRTLPKTEAAARTRRYQELTRLAQDLHADALITAHHADDQVETLLFRILRGTGIDGLAGIQKRLVLQGPENANVPILRPLLDVSRQTIAEYAKEQNLGYFNDPTNRNTKIQRNNLRNKIIPFLEGYFPQMKNALFKMALVAEGDLEIVEEKMDVLWASLLQRDKSGEYLDAMRFNQLGLPYQRRIIKRFLARHQVQVDFQAIEETIAFLEGLHRKDLSSSLKSLEKTVDGKPRFLALYRNRLRVIPAQQLSVEPPHEGTLLNLPGDTHVPNLQVTVRAVSLGKVEKKQAAKRLTKPEPDETYVDLSRFADKPLQLRTRRPGDKIRPLGMAMPMRLKKLMMNRGIPRFERERLPLLACDNQILWAPGVGLAEEVKVTGQPTHLLKIVYGNEPLPPFPVPAEEVEELPASEATATEALREESLADILASATLQDDDEDHDEEEPVGELPSDES